MLQSNNIAITILISGYPGGNARSARVQTLTMRDISFGEREIHNVHSASNGL